MSPGQHDDDAVQQPRRLHLRQVRMLPQGEPGRGETSSLFFDAVEMQMSAVISGKKALNRSFLAAGIC